MKKSYELNAVMSLAGFQRKVYHKRGRRIKGETNIRKVSETVGGILKSYYVGDFMKSQPIRKLIQVKGQWHRITTQLPYEGTVGPFTYKIEKI